MRIGMIAAAIAAMALLASDAQAFGKRRQCSSCYSCASCSGCAVAYSCHRVRRGCEFRHRCHGRGCHACYSCVSACSCMGCTTCTTCTTCTACSGCAAPACAAGTTTTGIYAPQYMARTMMTSQPHNPRVMVVDSPEYVAAMQRRAQEEAQAKAQALAAAQRRVRYSQAPVVLYTRATPAADPNVAPASYAQSESQTRR